MARPALMLLDETDNVLIACRNLGRGERVSIDGRTHELAANLPLGFKLARRPIAQGEEVIKLGMTIGRATRGIGAGELVHTTNLASAYTPTFTLDAGARFIDKEGG